MIENKLKTLTSAQAATLLMETFPVERPNYSEAFKIIAHRSWKRPDQVRLARFYLKKLPFANSKPYEVFASFMAIPTLISVFKEVLPSKSDDLQFFVYYVAPILTKNVKSENDRYIVEEFLSELDPMHTSAVSPTMYRKFIKNSMY
jgi:hypothetical protein